MQKRIINELNCPIHLIIVRTVSISVTNLKKVGQYNRNRNKTKSHTKGKITHTA